MTEGKANLLHFLIMRWVALLNVVLLFAFNLNSGPLLVFLVVLTYNLMLTIFWRQVASLLRKYPSLSLIDITLSALLIWLTCGSWSSPYFLFALISLMIASFFSGLRYGIIAAVYFSFLYSVGLLLNKATLAKLANAHYFDVLTTSYVAIFIIATFFGYPAHIIRQIEKLKEEADRAEESLLGTKKLISAVSTVDTLSCRELEILSSLSKGKTNNKISAELHITEQTVKNHLYRIYKKLGVSSREEAILYFHSAFRSEANQYQN